MNEPLWISKKAVLAMHNAQLAEHGGSDGIRDETLLDSALAKPLNVLAYADQPDIFRLAASYAFGIARNHAFVDGNKRTALVVSLTFLDRNGWDIVARKRMSISPSSTSPTVPSTKINSTSGSPNTLCRYSPRFRIPRIFSSHETSKECGIL